MSISPRAARALALENMKMMEAERFHDVPKPDPGIEITCIYDVISGKEYPRYSVTLCSFERRVNGRMESYICVHNLDCPHYEGLADK